MAAFLSLVLLFLTLFCLPLLIPNSVHSLRQKADIYPRKYLYLADFLSAANPLLKQQLELALEHPKVYLAQYASEANFQRSGYLIQTQDDPLEQQAYLPIAALVSGLYTLERLVLIDKQNSAFAALAQLSSLLNAAGLEEFDLLRASECENAWEALVFADRQLQQQDWCLLWIWTPAKHYAVSLSMFSAWQPIGEKTQGFDGWGDIRYFSVPSV